MVSQNCLSPDLSLIGDDVSLAGHPLCDSCIGGLTVGSPEGPPPQNPILEARPEI